MDPDSTIGWAASMCFTSINHISKGINPWKFGKKYPYTPENHISLKVVFPYLIMLGSLHKLRLHFLAFDHVCTPLSLHFLCIKFSIFLTIYPPLNANVICEGSPIKHNMGPNSNIIYHRKIPPLLKKINRKYSLIRLSILSFVMLLQERNRLPPSKVVVQYPQNWLLSTPTKLRTFFLFCLYTIFYFLIWGKYTVNNYSPL